MSTLNPPKPITKRQELREDNVITFYAKAWQFFTDNRMLIYGILAGLVLAVLAVIAWAYYQDQRADEAQALLGKATALYDAGQYEQALQGTDTVMGLLAIADDYGSTQAGNLAHFYAADALFQTGQYEQALEYFEDFDADDSIVGASAIAGIAAVYEQQGELERAGDYYRRAASRYESLQTSPQYLLEAGRAYEEAGAYDKAMGAYQEIQQDYPESALATGIDFYIARIQARQRAS